MSVLGSLEGFGYSPTPYPDRYGYRYAFRGVYTALSYTVLTARD